MSTPWESRVFAGKPYNPKAIQGDVASEEKHIELVYFQYPDEMSKSNTFDSDIPRIDANCKSAMKDLNHGMNVNLGIGMPLVTPVFLTEWVEVILQYENGILGMAGGCQGRRRPVFFGNQKIYLRIGFGRISLNMLDTLQVNMDRVSLRASEDLRGRVERADPQDVVNYMLPGKVKGIDGAINLVANSSKIKVISTSGRI
ncbi:hypothetical protein EDB81DRAFT_884111 [Dactylonectria macrodidyma]|uniref:Uncharacterized protein n=1 Tax=Dactylonectria macrodidyma TaxID=307937 RepID=A0A9P9ESG1_9HYPO|nr:hypothetical protein EDB81DRAFT_884111 [Dactylonectria macrodidyma]